MADASESSTSDVEFDYLLTETERNKALNAVVASHERIVCASEDFFAFRTADNALVPVLLSKKCV